MTEMKRRCDTNAPTLEAPISSPQGLKLDTRIPVTREPSSSTNTVTGHSTSKLIRNMVGSALIGGAIAGGALYGHFTGWKNPFAEDQGKPASSASSEPTTDKTPAYSAKKKEIKNAQDLGNALQALGIEVTEKDFESCPKNPHMRFLILQITQLNNDGTVEYKWLPVFKRVTPIHPFKISSFNEDGTSSETSQDEFIISVKIDNSHLINSPLDFEGFQPAASLTNPNDPSIRFVYYDPHNKKHPQLLSQIGFKWGRSVLGARSFHIPKIEKVSEDAGSEEYDTGLEENEPVE
jgi:hypothetical protein